MKYEKEIAIKSPQPISTIDAFPSAALSKEPLLYPGIRPETSFLLHGKDVFAVSVEWASDALTFSIESPDGIRTDLNSYLEDNGVAIMEDRVPILAYGANMCPASIYSKFDKVGREDAHIVPTIYGQLTGYDVVWSGGPGMNGNFIANLYNGPETTDTTITVGVNFLTKEQLLVMHGTELAYDLTMVEVIVEGKPIKACVYAGMDKILLRNGHPVAVDGIVAEPGSRQLESDTTRELVEWMLTQQGVRDELMHQGASNLSSADDYIENTRELIAIKGAKTARKKAIHAVLEASGHSKAYRLPLEPSAMQSWANPSTIPSYGEQLSWLNQKNLYVLPTSEITKGSWPDEAKRELVLRAISTHHMRMTGLEERELK